MIQKVTKYGKEWAAARKLAKEVADYSYLVIKSGSFGYAEDVKEAELEMEEMEKGGFAATVCEKERLSSEWLI